jgi:ADP-ribosyl-[dinitrogen reductase] hydrolase
MNMHNLAPPTDSASALRDRVRGALVGLAVGDAVGTAVEFEAPGSFPPVTDMTGGGAFGLEPGQWTDDTSMALCLAESLIERRGFDARDQMERYVRWWREGHLSSTGRCFDIGNTTRAALDRSVRTGDPFAGSTDAHTAGNGSLMRLAPVAMCFVSRPGDAVARAAESSRTTHGARVAVDACRYLAALLVGAMRGASREALLGGVYEPEPRLWDASPLHEEIAAIAAGSFRAKSPPAIRGTGYAARSLEAALWAFARASDFREACLLAANLGEDADTTAAICGQLAGAHWGESGIPAEWRERLAMWEVIDRYAEELARMGMGMSR